jgi:hypothetical protein
MGALVVVSTAISGNPYSIYDFAGEVLKAAAGLF